MGRIIERPKHLEVYEIHIKLFCNVWLCLNTASNIHQRSVTYRV